ncbi:MAG: Replicative DNA helicase [Chlamydiia bacterium]|nr:Replicative DNA helicase [Chlamydiia bacterium]
MKGQTLLDRNISPSSKESEMMVLGCMLTHENSLSIGADSLEEKDFYYKEHQLIFAALKTTYSKDKPADVHLIAEILKTSNELDGAGGVAYLTEVAQYAGTSAYIEEYIEIIKNKSILRRMILAANDIKKVALEQPDDVNSALDEAQSMFFKISQTVNQTIGVSVKNILDGTQAESKLPYLKDLQQRQEKYHTRDPNEPLTTGIPTGLTDLDKLLGGLNPANLVIVAGRPSMGKTALGINIAEHICFNLNKPVAVFSLEMTSEELLHRMICTQSEVTSEKIKMGALDGSEYQRIVSTVSRMQEHTFIIDDQPGLKITDLRARARRLKEVYDIQFLLIDYIQLLSGSRSSFNTENRQTEISEISRMLKNLARELNIPILVPSQLSRKVEERAGHRPMMSDLRESGSIEQDADCVMMIYRRDYYNATDHPGMAEIIVAKNRHGSIGDVKLAFRKEYAQFTNYAHEPDSNADPFSPFNG